MVNSTVEVKIISSPNLEFDDEDSHPPSFNIGFPDIESQKNNQVSIELKSVDLPLPDYPSALDFQPALSSGSGGDGELPEIRKASFTIGTSILNEPLTVRERIELRIRILLAKLITLYLKNLYHQAQGNTELETITNDRINVCTADLFDLCLQWLNPHDADDQNQSGHSSYTEASNPTQEAVSDAQATNTGSTTASSSRASLSGGDGDDPKKPTDVKKEPDDDSSDSSASSEDFEEDELILLSDMNYFHIACLFWFTMNHNMWASLEGWEDEVEDEIKKNPIRDGRDSQQLKTLYDAAKYAISHEHSTENFNHALSLLKVRHRRKNGKHEPITADSYSDELDVIEPEPIYKDYLLAWIILAFYNCISHAGHATKVDSPIDLSDINSLTGVEIQFLNNSFDDYCRTHYEEPHPETISILLLYYLGALPTKRTQPNLLIAKSLLKKIKKPHKKNLSFFLVSYNTLDLMRFGSISPKLLGEVFLKYENVTGLTIVFCNGKDQCTSEHPPCPHSKKGDPIGFYKMMTVLQAFCCHAFISLSKEFSDKDLEETGIKHILDDEVSAAIFSLLTDFFEGVSVKGSIKDRVERVILAYKTEFKEYIKNRKADDYFSYLDHTLFNQIMTQIIYFTPEKMSRKKRKDQPEVTLDTLLKATEKSSNIWLTVHTQAQQEGNYEVAIRACEELYKQCQPMSESRASYWENLKKQYQNLMEELGESSSKSDQTKIPKDKKKKKKKIKKHKAEGGEQSSLSDQPLTQESLEKNEDVADMSVSQSTAIQRIQTAFLDLQSLIPVTKEEDALDISLILRDWWLQGSKKRQQLEPTQRANPKYRNKPVQRNLENGIHEAEFFQYLERIRRNPMALGIDKVYENLAWSALNSFISHYNVSETRERLSYSESEIKDLESIIEQARKIFISCFGYCICFDKISQSITPEEFENMAEGFLSANIHKSGDKAGVYHRFCSIAGSIGHCKSYLKWITGQDHKEKNRWFEMRDCLEIKRNKLLK
ncbi:hypothetical protein ACH42_11255 [Endozoicomonas sp. (ex Bugula neritina AB1)]|nr:hypothetical protein ACH42_11255 [Endozoicomonas sp. (ex Bugula neritina AB1)]